MKKRCLDIAMYPLKMLDYLLAKRDHTLGHHLMQLLCVIVVVKELLKLSVHIVSERGFQRRVIKNFV